MMLMFLASFFHPRRYCCCCRRRPLSRRRANNWLTTMQLFATYYPIAVFPLLVPVAIAYSLAGHLWCRLWGQPPLAPLPTPQQVSGRAKVAIVTGSNTGIGYETARSLAVDYGMTVVLACRSRSKGEAAAQKIQREGGTAVFALLDLSSSQSIKTFSNSMREKFNKQVGILVCNAGCNASTNEPVVNDRDWLYQVNFLGHFDLTAHLMGVLAPQARIVTVASAMHHFITGNVETVEFWKDCASFSRPAPASRYSASKLAAVLFTIELNRRYAGRVQSVAVNPGGV
jgi:NAD(P)-dependent dehydrogenase (short-subunit alcohol dehydrogenase family)